MPRLIYSTRPPVPVDALRLNEDIRALERAQRELKSVDRYNVNEDPDKDELWLCIQKIGMMRRYAEQKLRTEFLDPRKRKFERAQRRVV